MTKKNYICQKCGSIHSRWAGKCDDCGEWNCIQEEIIDVTPKGMSAKKGCKIEFHRLDDEQKLPPRLSCYISELNRVLGGGLVEGSIVLIGGDPGIGKSTLLLQVAANLANNNIKTAYISGEESIAQVQMRADRLGYADSPVELASANNVRDIIASLKIDKPRVAIIDSIQTMFVDNIDSAPGTVTQVRASANELTRFAKKNNICIILVGHVTKDGQLAGPRVLEHMVDCVLYFEGDRGHIFRILRTVKNRFGATDEIGVFEMCQKGLQEVTNPSTLFLSQREQQVSGSAIFAGMEGSRPIMVEFQALVAPTTMATPRRSVVGWDNSRLAMILAVMESRAGISFSDKEVYLNVAGGLKVNEPAADMAAAAALLSAITDSILPNNSIFFGEIGLSGEIRSVARTDIRIKEALKLGFEKAYMPKIKKFEDSGELDIKMLEFIGEMLELIKK